MARPGAALRLDPSPKLRPPPLPAGSEDTRRAGLGSSTCPERCALRWAALGGGGTMLDPSSSEEESDGALEEEERRDVLVVAGGAQRALPPHREPGRPGSAGMAARPASPSPSVRSEGREEQERLQRQQEGEKRLRLQLYVFVVRCIAYPFNAKQPTDMARRQQKVRRGDLPSCWLGGRRGGHGHWQEPGSGCNRRDKPRARLSCLAATCGGWGVFGPRRAQRPSLQVLCTPAPTSFSRQSHPRRCPESESGLQSSPESESDSRAHTGEPAGLGAALRVCPTPAKAPPALSSCCLCFCLPPPPVWACTSGGGGSAAVRFRVGGGEQQPISAGLPCACCCFCVVRPLKLSGV